jgi:predicted KAP-like P-loop ATPase
MSQRAVDQDDEQVAMSLWSDNPTSIDLLGFRDTTELIEKVLLDHALGPVTVGIEGDWGSGKTSMLKLLARKLSPDDSVIVVETRPWEYDPAMDPKATLIAEVLDAIHTEADRRNLLDRVRSKFKTLAKRVRVSELLKLAVTAAAAAGGLPKVAEFLGLFDEEAETVSDQGLHGFRKEFEDLMKALPEIQRVVVLVDDLDRCLPQTVVATLEAVKLFLSVEGMAFVLAADRRVVAHAVETKYQPSPDAAELGRQYSACDLTRRRASWPPTSVGGAWY